MTASGICFLFNRNREKWLFTRINFAIHYNAAIVTITGLPEKAFHGAFEHMHAVFPGTEFMEPVMSSITEIEKPFDVAVPLESYETPRHSQGRTQANMGDIKSLQDDIANDGKFFDQACEHLLSDRLPHLPLSLTC